MKSAIVVLALPLALAGCNSRSSGPTIDEKNASVAEVANKVQQAQAEGFYFDPGRWEASVTVDEMSIPGMPPQAAAMMKKSIGTAHSFATCLTPEKAKKPEADFFSGNNKDCRYDHFTMTGGTLDAKMICGGEESGEFAVSGNYSPDSYHMTMQGQVAGGPKGSMMTMRSHVDSKRVGACTGKEES